MSGIEYERTMKLTYPVELSDQQYGKLTSRLNDKGMRVGGAYDWNGPDPEKFGYKADTKTTKRNVLYANNENIAECRGYEKTLEEAHQGLIEAFPELNISYGQEKTEITSKKWFEPNGVYLWCKDEDMVGSPTHSNIYYDFEGVKCAIKMQVRIRREVRRVQLCFSISWSPEKTQRKAAIEKALVDTVLGDMNLITTTLERILKAKKDWGWDGEGIEIDCHFDAITNRRSDCAPDIVAMVRAERQAKA
jgi:hypothetical protein